MGFPEIRCKKALIATGNNGAETAMNWLFEHMDDLGYNVFIFKNSQLNIHIFIYLINTNFMKFLSQRH